MEDFVFNPTRRYADTCIMEEVEKGRNIDFQVLKGELNFSDLPYADIVSYMIFLAYELGKEKWQRL